MKPCTFQPKLEKKSTRGKFLILQETETLKKLLICSQKKAFLIILVTETPKKLFIFREMEPSHILRKLYSELWYIQGPSIFKTNNIPF